MLLRRAIHAQGLRYRLHAKQLPGKPDLIFARFRAVIFVHGCYWHGHDCELFRIPATRAAFWEKKITGNRERDNRVLALLHQMGWRTLVVWECAFRGKHRSTPERVSTEAIRWLHSDAQQGELRGVAACP